MSPLNALHPREFPCRRDVAAAIKVGRGKRLVDRSPSGTSAKSIPPFAALKAFESVGRLGGIRKAAASLELDHAVVSRHLKHLEEWLGAILFDRSGKQLSLTNTGVQYHRSVSHALAELASATDDLLRTEQTKLLVWCVPGFAAQWAADKIAEFELAFPEYTVELRPTDEIADLARNQADVDIRFYDSDLPSALTEQDVVVTELARPAIVPVTSPALAKSLGPLESVAELQRAPLLHEVDDQQWRAWFRANGLEPQPSLPGPLMWHAHLALAAAKKGRGIALANRYLAGSDLERGKLVELCPPHVVRPILGAYMFVTRKSRASTPAVVALRRFLASQI